jgi:phosphoenolpyruvate phosphomutase
MTDETPAARLRARLAQPGPVLAAGAHSALSARLAEVAGFDAIWASGFEISAAHAVPDANILTMAEQLQAAREMARAVRLPVIADCDNGFGNAINVIRTVQDYEADGIAGVSIEDNVFPKRCSFYPGRRDLASIDEHAGKVRAACRARRSDDFVVIARTEALIAGWGLDEALARGRAYADAGADLVLVHSKASTFDELRRFADAWDRAAPLVAVPTIYKDVSADDLAAHGFKLVIFANHGLRAGIRAMREAFHTLVRDRRASAVDDRVCALEEVYALIGVPEMQENEREFMPAPGQPVRAVILAAGASAALGELTADRPKAMLEVRGRTILDHQLAALRACGVHDVAVVRGYKKESLDAGGARVHDNDRWAETGELASLLAARRELEQEGRTLVLYGDIIFDPPALRRLLDSPADVAVLVDRAWPDERRQGLPLPTDPDLVCTMTGPATPGARYVVGLHDDALVRAIGQRVDPDAAEGEFAGALALSRAGAQALLDAVSRAGPGPFHEAPDVDRAALTDALQELVARGQPVTAVSIYKGWSEVDTFDDYRRAWTVRASAPTREAS